MFEKDNKISSGFSEIETLFIVSYFKHLKTTPDADWDAIAKDRNYDNVKSARRYFNKLKAKHGLTTTTANDSGGDMDTPKSTKKRPTQPEVGSPSTRGKKVKEEMD